MFTCFTDDKGNIREDHQKALNRPNLLILAVPMPSLEAAQISKTGRTVNYCYEADSIVLPRGADGSTVDGKMALNIYASRKHFRKVDWEAIEAAARERAGAMKVVDDDGFALA